MLSSAFTYLACVLAAPASPDTLTIPLRQAPPHLDGQLESNEYGLAAIHLPTASGRVDIWLSRTPGWIHLAAFLPDTSFYWGDDLVISLDPDGSGGARPGAGDRQWYLRRVLDSTRIFVSSGGRWISAGQEPPALGPVRADPDWELAANSSHSGWTVELRIRQGAFATASTAPPRLGLRTYNDQPSGWWSWPEPPVGIPARRVEQTPDLWIPVRLR